MIQLCIKKKGQKTWKVGVDQTELRQGTEPQVAKRQDLKGKRGTQHIDRCWKFIKQRLSKGTCTRAGMRSLQAQIRSAQYEYWYRGEDMWVRTGDLLATYMYDIVSP